MDTVIVSIAGIVRLPQLKLMLPFADLKYTPRYQAVIYLLKFSGLFSYRRRKVKTSFLS